MSCPATDEHVRRVDGALAAGALDATAEQWFPAVPDRVRAHPVEGLIVFDAQDLRFLEFRALLHRQRHPERRSVMVTPCNPPATAAHLVELLRLSRIRIGAAR
ncbi:hypothetical protein Dvina_24810 [Dactylosporangium vinaceum]|uniref:STAS domain-containing protein n=1 Tax=Dactylosporangium vinaceum TaxID=53362 RepID=A0ABV5LY54_9ACTN|nr:hypothetical protein [Dactylosporangium vinaceum]UAC00987.1 hypothetical protein Dvina_24810 [Dactylosporangium vinaceum]